MVAEDYPATLLEFEARFPTEEACRDYLGRLRWPQGFRCPRCQASRGWPRTRGLVECGGCGYQASPTAGTIFEGTRIPLRLWFRAMWQLLASVEGVYSAESTG